MRTLAKGNLPEIDLNIAIRITCKLMAFGDNKKKSDFFSMRKVPIFGSVCFKDKNNCNHG